MSRTNCLSKYWNLRPLCAIDRQKIPSRPSLTNVAAVTEYVPHSTLPTEHGILSLSKWPPDVLEVRVGWPIFTKWPNLPHVLVMSLVTSNAFYKLVLPSCWRRGSLPRWMLTPLVLEFCILAEFQILDPASRCSHDAGGVFPGLSALAWPCRCRWCR